MDIGFMVNLSTSNTQNGSDQNPVLRLTGLINNPTYGPVAEHAQTVGVDISIADDSPVTAAYQWCTVATGPIAGATDPTFTPDTQVHALQSLFCAVSIDGQPPRMTPQAVIRDAPPALIAAPFDAIFDEDTGDQVHLLDAVFSGLNLDVTTSTPAHPYDPDLDGVIIDTSTANTGTLIRVVAQNSGGQVETEFTVTIESADANMVIYVDPNSAEIDDIVAVSAAAITAGDPLGHWQIVDQILRPSAAGDAADLDQGLYQLELADGAEIDINITPALQKNDWALSSPRPDGFDLVIFNIPSHPQTPVTDIQISLSGAPWTGLGITEAGIYTITGLETDATHRVSLRAFNGAAGPITTKSIATYPNDPRGFRGWQPDLDLGAGGDIFVAPYGDDTNAGTTIAPFASVSAAISAADPNDTIKVRAGRYEEALRITKPITIEGYGTEKPEITSAKRLTGFTRCGPDDAAILGHWATIDTPVFKTTLPLSAITHEEIDALNIFEASRRLSVATDRADRTDLFDSSYKPTFYVSPTDFGLDPNGQVRTITDPAILNTERYTDSQLLNAKVSLVVQPNVIQTVAITAVDLATHTITIAGEGLAQETGDVNTYALDNVPLFDIPGTYCAFASGNMVNIYLRPRRERDLDLIDYSAEGITIEIEADVNNVNLNSLHVSRAAGRRGSGINILNRTGDAESTGIRLQNLLITGNACSEDWGYAVRLNATKDSTLKNCSVFDTLRSMGINLSGISNLNGSGNIVDHCHFEKIASTAIRCAGQSQMVFAHNYVKSTGLAAHSNRTNAYQQCHQILWWANEFDRSAGYITWQQASDINIAWNYSPVYSRDNSSQTALRDQSSQTLGPVANSTGYIFNNSIFPQQGNISAGSAISLTNPLSDITMSVANNIAHGITAPGRASPPFSLFKSNITTALVYDGEVQNISDFAPENLVIADLSLIFNTDFSLVDDSPALHLIGQDMRPAVAELQVKFSTFLGFDRDYKGQFIDWDRFPVGADSAENFIRSATLSQPVGSRTSETSATGSVTTDYPLGTLYAGLWDTPTPPTSQELKDGLGALFHTLVQNPGAGAQVFAADTLVAENIPTWYFLHTVDGQDTSLAGVQIDPFSAANGPNLMADPGFDDPDKWNTQNGHSVAGGVFTIATSAASYTTTTTAPGYSSTVTPNTDYVLGLDIVEVTDDTRMRIFIKEQGGGGLLDTLYLFDTKTEGPLVAGTRLSLPFTTGVGTDEVITSFNKIGTLGAIFDNISLNAT